ncbi:Bug family tripartite tricarboxylate transporter substrate binding protein [Cupriavidus pinatubonensis]|uniref:Bug family tripartite tricarboxylate transporter substrate binding protein n=1 Tax=Cupriavidus pinatubonensis TaxID=248026 RepID=UPI0011296431|nr:tripartite tricarboxylate transporter substrate binding protein [Cupriavidus pinatubonensis]TPQ42458.1 tripartite tricarboxylate transporter substrate binding protein [Cupriavidus pinatubonensis]
MLMFKRRALRLLCPALATLAALAIAAPVKAGDYPERPVKIVSVTSAGTGVDDYTRLLAKYLSDKLGQSFVVENRPGGNMVVATDYVSKAAPDGYTLLLSGSGAMAANPFLFRRLPYDPMKDFVPVARLSVLPIAVIVPGNSPYHTAGELIAAARANPGKLNFATSSTGYRVILTAFNDAAKIQSVSVPYKAASAMMTDVMGGMVDYGGVEVSAIIPHVQSGKLRALAITGPSRLAQLKDVPTLRELGLERYSLNTWVGLFAPAGTPKPIVDKLTRLALQFTSTPEAMAHYQARGSAAYPADGAELRKNIVADQQGWKQMITVAGIQPE